MDPDKAIRIARFFSYPKQVLYLLASFIVAVSLCHHVSLAYRLHNRAPSKRFRLPLAIIDSLRAFAFRWNLAEPALTVGYLGVLLTWTFVNTTATTGVKAEPHYYANRAATIAAVQLPIMTALGMRNNLVSLLTGVSFDKLNYLHRASARSLVILAWTHAGGRILGVGLTDDETLPHTWVRCGLLAASSLTLLAVLSIRPIRKKNYEAFLQLHTVLSLMFIIAIFFHLRGRNLTYYGPWPSMLLWGLDRFLRWVRLALFNPLGGYTANLSLLSPSFLKLQIPLSSHLLKLHGWRPGQSVFLSFPSMNYIESHPFTIVTVDDELVFFIRVREGLTKRLLNQESPLKVYLNGPYSSPPILTGYHSVILIAGGSGVAFTLPILLDLINQIKAGRKPETRRILFIWIIRNKEYLTWISSILSPSLIDLPPDLLSLQIYVTSKSDSESDLEKVSSSSSSTDTEKSLLASPLLQMHTGRPDLSTLIDAELQSTDGSRVSVNVCGPQTLAQATRRAIRTPRFMKVLHGGPTVTLHVEQN